MRRRRSTKVSRSTLAGAAGGGSVFGFACCCLVEAKRTTKIAELRTILSASAAPP